MLYLLGGAARTGKTAIARAFLAQTGIPFFSLDFLMMGFANGLPEYGVDSEADELLIAEQLWPVIRSMATAMVEDEIDYLIEGVQLHPRRVAELCEEFGGAVRVCFLGLAEVDTSIKLQEIRRFGGGADDWLRHYSDQELIQEIERLKSLSVRLQSACRECGLVYFEAADDLSSTVTRVIRYLSKGNAS
jgi:chloramphenicol 3-O-phosphotransferase